MDSHDSLDRRTLLQSAAVAAGLAATGHAALAAEGNPAPRFDNAQFYGPDGKFDEDRGKDAVLALCRHHGYPVFPELRDGLWVSDYGIGQFATLGLAAYIFVNNVEHRYMMLDIFLLPGQMLPEHWHVAGEGNPAKLEGWLVRWGLSHIVGVGEPNLTAEIAVPKCHWGGKTTAQHVTSARAGQFVPLSVPESPHWQLAGPAGAIVTEVANVHTNSAVRHSDPVLNRNFLGA